MALTQLEQYGATYALDETIYNRIVSGMDTIRGYDGWSNFRIPEYIWEYVGQSERDTLVTHLTNWYYVNRTEQQFTDAGANREMLFAFTYALFLYDIWWITSAANDVSTYNSIHSDYGMPEAAQVNDKIYEPGNTVQDYYFIWIEGYYSTGDIYTYTEVYPLICANNFEYAYRHLDTDEEGYNYYSDGADGWIEILIGLPQVGIAADWSDGYFNKIVIESANITINEWGIASGTVTMGSTPVIGSAIEVKDNATLIFTGIVMGYTYDIANKNYAVRVADMVSAKAYNNITYEAGNPVTILDNLITSYGGTFTSTVLTTETFYSTGEKTSWPELVKSICLALGAMLVYQPDGSYLLTDTFNTHNLTNSNIYGDTTAQRELNIDNYKNAVYATISDEWETPWTTGDGETVDVYEGLKLKVTITRKGNQVIRIVTKDKITDVDTTETFIYDVNGYLTTYDMTKSEANAKHELTKTFTVTDDNNYDYTINETFAEKWPGETTWRTGKNIITDAEIHLDGVSKIEVVTQQVDRRHYFENGGSDEFVAVNEDKKEYEIVDTGITASSDFAVKQRVVRKNYTWQPILTSIMPWEYTMGWWFTGVDTDAMNPTERLTKTPATVKHSVNLKVSAKDEASITALGKELDEETSLMGINNITLLENAARNILRRRARVRELHVETVLNAAIKIGDTVTWDGGIWTVNTITHSLDSNGTTVIAKQNSTLKELQVALQVITNKPINEIIKAIKRQSGTVHNVTRGKIIEVLDNETYTIEVQK